MPRAEVGSTKYVANKMKSKGLGRLRWFCQECEKQCRDENGFKCHVQSESHVRKMLVVGSDFKGSEDNYSKQFQHDFLQQLRTAHGTKAVHINHYYQEYIHNKEHVHMNATRWKSLTEFAKFLSREGICRVEETDKGLHIAWIDNSPEALRRQDAIRKKERMDKGDEEREQRLIQEQVERAQENVTTEQETESGAKALQRADGEKITLNFGAKPVVSKLPTPPRTANEESSGDESARVTTDGPPETVTPPVEEPAKPTDAPTPAIKMSFGTNSSKPKNVFAVKKNPLATKIATLIEQPKKMSEAERIMKEEMERKRSRESSGQVGFSMKRQRMS